MLLSLVYSDDFAGVQMHCRHYVHYFQKNELQNSLVTSLIEYKWPEDDDQFYVVWIVAVLFLSEILTTSNKATDSSTFTITLTINV